MKLQYKQILLAPRYGITKLVEDDVYLISGGGGDWAGFGIFLILPNS